MSACYYCSEVFSANIKVFRSTECPKCKRDVRVCRNCRYYSPGSHWDCRETVSDEVTDKERANFCDWFKLADAPPGGGAKGFDREGQARKGFAALFGEPGDD